MQKLVECVPNFSEGRDLEKIRLITDEIETVPGVQLLDVDPGADTNRTVVTFVGSPDDAVEAAFRAIRKAAQLIDMATHSGEHPRMGATDVCPFVPLQGTTMEDCAALARTLGERVGKELGISVYLYGEAASSPQRQSLADVRSGEYEAMAEKIRKPEWKPDFGPTTLNTRAGVTAVGAREFLIAYNVNLNTKSKTLAHEVALDVRELGRNKRGADGKFVRDADGTPVKESGRLKECRAVGWFIDEYARAQISMNLTNYKVTSMHAAFDACEEEARKYGLRVTGSELVGLIPLDAMRDAGRHYLEKQGLSTGVPERDLIELAIQSLGLAELGEFDPEQKIIEYRVQKRTGRLIDMTVQGFADELSTDSPAPGGGSVAALCGALGGALAAMVANLTIGKKKLQESWDAMRPVGDQGQSVKDRLLHLVDADTDAFNSLMAAMRLPKNTDEEVAARTTAMQDATKEATLIPFRVLEASLEVLGLAETAAEHGNPNSASDAGVAALCARTCAEGAFLNVLINLPGIDDRAWTEDLRTRAQAHCQAARRQADAIVTAVEKKIAEQP